ncbi:hypothetical protein KSP40_PGU020471 [Platanthera guangdongensis]|uniref:Glycosyl transferase CAP10 domain-containing protein n=1 Tax=Platanthera guangdongensis TaxID=2320717 RepID=A0ABR2M9X2_9ASPA
MAGRGGGGPGGGRPAGGFPVGGVTAVDTLIRSGLGVPIAPEVNIKPWDEQFREIKRSSQAIPWKNREAIAYWKGNPDVQSTARMELLNCNDTKQWKAQIMRQDWVQESNDGFKNSKLSEQCKHR